MGSHKQNPLAVKHSQLFVGTDGNAYTAFTNFFWTLEASNCSDGSSLAAGKFQFHYNNTLVLWKISSEGDHDSTDAGGGLQATHNDISSSEGSPAAVPFEKHNEGQRLRPD